MTVCRALPLVALLVALPCAATAQFGGMPGMPGSMPGPGGFGGAPSGPPSGPPPACQQLLAMRDEIQKHGMAIQKANERKAALPEACRLFKNYLAAETKFMKSLEENGRSCGAPPDVLKQVKEGHTKASQIGKEVCEAAAQGPRPAGPSLSDALGAGPAVPSSPDGKRGGATFDTLSGNVLSR